MKNLQSQSKKNQKTKEPSLFQQWKDYNSDGNTDKFEKLSTRISELAGRCRLDHDVVFEAFHQNNQPWEENEPEEYLQFVNSIISNPIINHPAPYYIEDSDGFIDTEHNLFGIPLHGSLHDLERLASQPEFVALIAKHNLTSDGAKIIPLGLMPFEQYCGLIQEPQSVYDLIMELSLASEEEYHNGADDNPTMSDVRLKNGIADPYAFSGIEQNEITLVTRLFVMIRMASPYDENFEPVYDFISGISEENDSEKVNLDAWEADVNALCERIDVNATFETPLSFEKAFDILLGFHVHSSFSFLCSINDADFNSFVQPHLIMDYNSDEVQIFQETRDGKFLGSVPLPKLFFTLFSESTDALIFNMVAEDPNKEADETNVKYHIRTYPNLASFQRATNQIKNVIH